MNYKIVYSKRRSIAIVVSPDSGVIVRAPYRTSQKNIDRFVQNKSSWIKKHLNEQAHLEKLTIKFSEKVHA
jgi:predicted metal-dependent hydrolase